MSAATPATIGVAIDVPLPETYAVLLPAPAPTTSTPSATTYQLAVSPARLLNDAMLLRLSTAPTAMIELFAQVSFA